MKYQATDVPMINMHMTRLAYTFMATPGTYFYGNDLPPAFFSLSCNDGCVCLVLGVHACALPCSLHSHLVCPQLPAPIINNAKL